MASRRRLFVLLYACSGAAALVYEVVWTRLLTLQLGHTVAAASTVLAAFMGGLAIGAWIAGRWNGLKAVPYKPDDDKPDDDKPREKPSDTRVVGHGLPPSPRASADHRSLGEGGQAVPAFLRAYAILELLVAAMALALPFALHASVPVLAWAYADGGAATRFALVRVVISLALV